ncbi:MAG: TRAP transporter fused permease subunit, partial [Thiotrichaceae bacterium]|nr:TRAP transporter fused permease subunit [Thiotrichaceae bacterium]
GTGYILLVFELTRRAVGFSLVLMVLFFFFHSFLADHFIGVFYGPPVPYSSLIDLLFLSEDGLFGIPVMAFADFIFLFILFGVFLFNAGAGDYFMDVAFALTRKQVGGPAKASVVSSALMATVSGSAGGNVAITGQFSIPLMKKAGFSSTMAGAIEAVASTGGQIMPPVMGATAFIMAYYIGVPYIKICLAALFPAALYFFSVYLMVHFEAQKKGLQLSSDDQTVISMNILIKRASILIPLGVIRGMLIAGFTATMAGFYGIISTFLISLVNKDTRIGPDTMISIFTDTLKFCIPIAAACACVGVVIGSIYISGLGLKMGGMILSMGNNNMLLTLIFTMIVSIILG